MNDFENYRTFLIAAFTAYVAYLNIFILIEYNKNQILDANAETNLNGKKCVIN